VVQNNLSKNFALILKRLNHHDAIFAKNEANICQEKSDRIA
jgi:hypothetical protein